MLVVLIAFTLSVYNGESSLKKLRANSLPKLFMYLFCHPRATKNSLKNRLNDTIASVFCDATHRPFSNADFSPQGCRRRRRPHLATWCCMHRIHSIVLSCSLCQNTDKRFGLRKAPPNGATDACSPNPLWGLDSAI